MCTSRDNSSWENCSAPHHLFPHKIARNFLKRFKPFGTFARNCKRFIFATNNISPKWHKRIFLISLEIIRSRFRERCSPTFPFYIRVQLYFSQRKRNISTSFGRLAGVCNEVTTPAVHLDKISVFLHSTAETSPRTALQDSITGKTNPLFFFPPQSDGLIVCLHHAEWKFNSCIITDKCYRRYKINPNDEYKCCKYRIAISSWNNNNILFLLKMFFVATSLHCIFAVSWIEFLHFFILLHYFKIKFLDFSSIVFLRAETWEFFNADFS